MLAPFSSASLSGGRKLPALFIHQHACIQLNQTVCESAARLTLLHASVPKLSSKLERRHTQAMHACTWLPSSRASSVPAEKGSCRSRVLWPVHGRESSFWGGRARPGLFAFFISMPGLPCIAVVAATCVLLPTGDRSRDVRCIQHSNTSHKGWVHCTHTHTISSLGWTTTTTSLLLSGPAAAAAALWVLDIFVHIHSLVAKIPSFCLC